MDWFFIGWLGLGGGPVFASGTAIGLVSGVFNNPSSTRYNWMSFVSAELNTTSLGVTIKTAP